MPTNVASVVWHGNLTEGSGKISSRTGAIDASYSLKDRVDETSATNPEELLAAAHAACFTMMLTALLTGAGHVATELNSKAFVTLDSVEGGFAISKIRLVVSGSVPGASEAEFHEFAKNAKENCPVSRALSSVPTELEATFHA